jgi:hypothetical protein
MRTGQDGHLLQLDSARQEMPRRQRRPEKPCQRCTRTIAVFGEKYCKSCRETVLTELRQSGYLQDDKPASMPSDELGRKSLSWEVIGGSAEIGNDGDDL